MRTMAPFRYWGAKVRMAQWIIEHLPEHEHFVETCAGSAAVLSAKPPSLYETVNDVYGDVVNFFRVIRDDTLSSRLIDLVALTPYALQEFQAAGIPTADPLEKAWRFFIRMQMAVVPGRSGWSYGVAGQSAKKANKPGRWAAMPEHLQRCAERFRGVQVTDWPVEECLDRLDAHGVLHFVDPPYIQESRPKSKHVYRHDDFDHESFVRAVQKTQHADVYLVHYPHEFYDKGPWRVIGDYESHRNIPNGSGRESVTERMYRFERFNASKQHIVPQSPANP